jgi:hypothetical protein
MFILFCCAGTSNDDFYAPQGVAQAINQPTNQCDIYNNNNVLRVVFRQTNIKSDIPVGRLLIFMDDIKLFKKFVDHTKLFLIQFICS